MYNIFPMKRFLMRIGHALAVFAFLCATACETPENGDVTIEVNPLSVVIPAEGGTAEVKATVPLAWKVDIQADWLEMSPSSGAKGSYTIVFSASKNETGQTRTASAVISIDDPEVEGVEPVTVAISQPSVEVTPPGPGPDPDPELTLSPSGTLSIGHEGGRLSLTVTSNVAWTASVEAADVTVTPASGDAGETTVVISVAENKVEKARETSVTFSYAGKTAVVTIAQEAAPHQEDLGFGVGGEVNGWTYGGTIDFEEVDLT